ncbi:MAG: ribbon-helix-helix protein, CopG family [Neisseriaceae bacterium]|nr:ribbon-helix-helix protein, CopG family [Neisseriaceae bacterium]
MAATLRMVTTQLSEPLFQHLETYAKEINRSKSWIVRQAITEWLDRNEKSADTAQQKPNKGAWDELFALIQEAHDSGEDMNFEPPLRENVWKHNPFLDND